MVGAPSYTSAVHRWNGAIATLKPKPAMMSARAASRAGLAARCRVSINCADTGE